MKAPIPIQSTNQAPAPPEDARALAAKAREAAAQAKDAKLLARMAKRRLKQARHDFKVARKASRKARKQAKDLQAAALAAARKAAVSKRRKSRARKLAAARVLAEKESRRPIPKPASKAGPAIPTRPLEKKPVIRVKSKAKPAAKPRRKSTFTVAPLPDNLSRLVAPAAIPSKDDSDSADGAAPESAGAPNPAPSTQSDPE
jgi:hypothetical protein